MIQPDEKPNNTFFLLGVEAPWSSESFTTIIQLAQCSGLWGGHLGYIASDIPVCSYGSQGQAEKKVLDLKLERLASSCTCLFQNGAGGFPR